MADLYGGRRYCNITSGRRWQLRGKLPRGASVCSGAAMCVPWDLMLPIFFSHPCTGREGHSMGGPRSFNVEVRNRRGHCQKRKFLPELGIKPGTQGPRPSTLSTKSSLHPHARDPRPGNLSTKLSLHPIPGTLGLRPSKLSTKLSFHFIDNQMGTVAGRGLGYIEVLLD